MNKWKVSPFNCHSKKQCMRIHRVSIDDMMLAISRVASKPPLVR